MTHASELSAGVSCMERRLGEVRDTCLCCADGMYIHPLFVLYIREKL